MTTTSTSSKPIIFLDIDGVLIPLNYDGTVQQSRDHFNVACVERLHRLVVATGAIIVLSSTWRITRLQEAKDEMRTYGLGFSHTTPIESHHIDRRSKEINAWRKENGMPTRFCVLDDQAKGLGEHLPYLVLVDSLNGLSERDIEVAANMLKGHDDAPLD